MEKLLHQGYRFYKFWKTLLLNFIKIMHYNDSEKYINNIQNIVTRSAINFCNIFLGGLAKVNPFSIL
jgi:hypothetical protein